MQNSPWHLPPRRGPMAADEIVDRCHAARRSLWQRTLVSPDAPLTKRLERAPSHLASRPCTLHAGCHGLVVERTQRIEDIVDCYDVPPIPLSARRRSGLGRAGI